MLTNIEDFRRMIPEGISAGPNGSDGGENMGAARKDQQEKCTAKTREIIILEGRNIRFCAVFSEKYSKYDDIFISGFRTGMTDSCGYFSEKGCTCRKGVV